MFCWTLGIVGIQVSTLVQQYVMFNSLSLEECWGWIYFVALDLSLYSVIITDVPACEKQTKHNGMTQHMPTILMSQKTRYMCLFVFLSG